MVSRTELQLHIEDEDLKDIVSLFARGWFDEETFTRILSVLGEGRVAKIVAGEYEYRILPEMKPTIEQMLAIVQGATKEE